MLSPAPGVFHRDVQSTKFFSEPPAYTALHVDAVAKLRGHEWEGLEQLMEQSASVRRPLSGQCNGKAFSDFHDGDDPPVCF